MTDATRLQSLLDDLRAVLHVTDDRGGRVVSRRLRPGRPDVEEARRILSELPLDEGVTSLSSQHYVDTGRYLVDEDALLGTSPEQSSTTC